MAAPIAADRPVDDAGYCTTAHDPVQAPRTTRFRYHAMDLDAEASLGTFGSQREATEAILKAGHECELPPGGSREYAVRIESIDSGSTYDIPLSVERLATAAPGFASTDAVA